MQLHTTHRGGTFPHSCGSMPGGGNTISSIQASLRCRMDRSFSLPGGGPVKSGLERKSAKNAELFPSGSSIAEGDLLGFLRHFENESTQCLLISLCLGAMFIEPKHDRHKLVLANCLCAGPNLADAGKEGPLHNPVRSVGHLPTFRKGRWLGHRRCERRSQSHDLTAATAKRVLSARDVCQASAWARPASWNASS